MPDDLPPLPNKPTNLAVASRNSNSLAVTWNAAANADRYELEVSWTGETRIFPASSPQKIEDLLAISSIPLFSNRIYNTRVRAVNIQGCSDWTDLLVTATPPPTPIPPSANASMIEVDVKVSWSIDLDDHVDLTFPIFVEIIRQEPDGNLHVLPNANNLPLKGIYVDEKPLTNNDYYIRLYSNILPLAYPNASQLSSPFFFRKLVFAKLQIPGFQENNTLRSELLKKYYGR